MLAGLYWLYLWPGRRPAKRCQDVRARARGAADLGRQRLDHRGRPAALAARHRRARRGGRPPPQPRGRPVLDRPVLRLRAARADGHRRPAGPRVRVAVRAPARVAAGRRRRGDDRRVRDRPAVRAAADPPLRRDPGRAAHALLRPRRRRLDAAAAPGRARTRWMYVGAVRRRSSRSPTCRGTRPSSRASSAASTSTARMYADLQRVGEAPAVRAAFARCAAAHRVRPPRRSRSPASSSTARPARSARSRAAPARWARCCCCRAATARRAASTRNNTFPIVQPPAGYTQIYRNAVLARVRRAGLRPSARPRRPPSSRGRAPRPRRGRRGSRCRPRRPRSARPTSASRPCASRCTRRRASRCSPARG